MGRKKYTCTVVALAGLGSGAWPQEGPVRFRKLLLNPEFYSEGITAGDFNQDGLPDAAAGPYYYPGPDFGRTIPFREPRSAPYDTSGDSDCYSIFPFDFNGDGWTDILTLRRPSGTEAVWYENPMAAAGYWKEHVVYSRAENESTALLDIDGDGKPELITNSNGYGGWASPDWSDPAAQWSFRKVTGHRGWGKYTHGIGAGDVNGDGRIDWIIRDGWWEQPAAPTGAEWKAHLADFGGQGAPLESPGGAQMYAYDVDGDGDNDVVTSLQAHGYGLAWFENLGGGTSFVAHQILGLPSEKDKYGASFSQLHALSIGDLDGDGLEDIVTGKRKGAHGRGLADVDSPAVLYWFRLTRPAGQPPRFTPYRIDGEAGVGTQITLADMNGDGRLDILTAQRRGAFVFFNEEAGTAVHPGPVPEDRQRAPMPHAPTIRFPVGDAEMDALGREPE